MLMQSSFSPKGSYAVKLIALVDADQSFAGNGLVVPSLVEIYKQLLSISASSCYGKIAKTLPGLGFVLERVSISEMPFPTCRNFVQVSKWQVLHFVLDRGR